MHGKPIGNSPLVNTFIFLNLLVLHIVESEWKGIEKPCLCQEFRCNDGVFCLDKSKVCNGEKDCPEGEDELIKKEYGKCRPPKRQNCR